MIGRHHPHEQLGLPLPPPAVVPPHAGRGDADASGILQPQVRGCHPLPRRITPMDAAVARHRIRGKSRFRGTDRRTPDAGRAVVQSGQSDGTGDAGHTTTGPCTVGDAGRTVGSGRAGCDRSIGRHGQQGGDLPGAARPGREAVHGTEGREPHTTAKNRPFHTHVPVRLR